MAAATFFVVPYAFYKLSQHKASIHDTIGQVFSIKVLTRCLVFEMVTFTLCFVLYLLSMFSVLVKYQFKQMVVYAFYCAINVAFLWL